jgi:hypothetical protein
MARITYVYGPIKTSADMGCLLWRFVGMRSDEKCLGWTLRYHIVKRRWSVVHATRPKKDEAKVATPEALFCVPHHRHENPTGKTVTETLKNCLPPEEIARAAAMSMTWRSS